MYDPLLPASLERTATDVASRTTADVKLKAADILLEDFKYAGKMAGQAKQDRIQLLALYTVLISVVAAAFGVVNTAYSGQFTSPKATTGVAFGFNLDLALVYGIGAILSFGFFVMLLRLSREYHASLVEMGVVKEFYITHLKDQLPEIEQVFPWRLSNVPAIGHFAGMFHLAIAFLSSVAFGVAVHFFYIAVSIRVEYRTDALQQSINQSLFLQAYALEALFAVAAGFGHWLYYRAATRSHRTAPAHTGKLV